MNRSRSWLRESIATLVLAATASVSTAAAAQTYTVQVKPELNGLDILIEPVPSPSILVIRMTNRTDQRVRCNLTFDASPQTPTRTRRMINPGQTTSSVLRATRRWFSVVVDVNCEPAV